MTTPAQLELAAVNQDMRDLATINSIVQSADSIAEALEQIRRVAAGLRTAKQESMILPPVQPDAGSRPAAAELAVFTEKLAEALNSPGLEQALSMRSPAMRIGRYQVNFVIHNLQLAADFAARNSSTSDTSSSQIGELQP